MNNSLQKQKSDLCISEGKHMRLNPCDTPILSRCVSYAKQYSLLNKRCMRNLINVWKDLPQNEREEYFTLDSVSKNVSYFCEGSRIHSPSPKKSRQRKRDEHTVSLQNLKKQNEQLSQFSVELHRELSRKPSLTRSPTLRNKSISDLSERRSNTPEISSFRVKTKNKEMEDRLYEFSTRSQTPIVKSRRKESSQTHLKNAVQGEGTLHSKSGLYYKSPGKLIAIKNSSIHSRNISKGVLKVAHELTAKEIELIDSKTRMTRNKAIIKGDGLATNSPSKYTEMSSCINIHGFLNCKFDKIELKLVNSEKPYEHDLYITCLKGANDLNLLRKYNIEAIFYIGDEANLIRYPGLRGGYSFIPLLLTSDSNLLKWIPIFDKFLDANLNKHCVLIACNDGVNRSCSVCIGYIMSKYSISMSIAYSILHSARPFLNLIDSLTKQLRAYDRKIVSLKAFLTDLNK